MSKPVNLKAVSRGALAATWHPLGKATAIVVLSMTGWTMAQAESLVDLYQAAKGYDAAYLSAKAQADSTQYQVDQAYALRRPSLGFKAVVSRSHFKSDADLTPAEQAQLAAVGGATSTNTTTKTPSLAAKLPLLNKADSVKVEQAEQALIAAQADMALAENDLLARLTQAYFYVLGAQDVLGTTQANKKAFA